MSRRAPYPGLLLGLLARGRMFGRRGALVARTRSTASACAMRSATVASDPTMTMASTYPLQTSIVRTSSETTLRIRRIANDAPDLSNRSCSHAQIERSGMASRRSAATKGRRHLDFTTEGRKCRRPPQSSRQIDIESESMHGRLVILDLDLLARRREAVPHHADIVEPSRQRQFKLSGRWI
jgi:hypothetical protein